MIETFLTSQIFAFLIIFTRVGSGVMLIPGIAESYVSPRIRLSFALLLSLAVTPYLQPEVPPVPTSPLVLTAILGGEMIIGLFFGFIARILISTMHTVGMIMSYQSSLAAATMFDISQAGQGSAIGNFLSVTTVVLLFATNMHHLMIQGLIDSYLLFTPGKMLPLDDMAITISRLVSDVFLVAVKLASPIIATGLIVYLAAGVLSRLMPNMQVFFVIIPPQIQLSFYIMMVCLTSIFMWYLDYVEAQLSVYVGRG